MSPLIRIAALLTLLCLTAAAHAQSLTIIDLKNRTAEEVLPVLRPLVGSDAALSGVDYRLLVRANEADVARIREALSVLDRAPRQLLVSVRYATQSQIERERVSVGGSVGVRNGQASGQLTVRSGSGRDAYEVGNISSVRVMEGQAAYVSSGERVPYVSAAIVSQRRAGVVIDERQVSTGFQVQPRVNGSAVTLDIGAQQEQLRNGDIATHSVNTSVIGQLGEWIALGGVDETGQSRSSGGSYRVTTASDQRQMWIKVDEVTP